MKDYLPSKKKRGHLIAREVAATLSLGLLYPFGLGRLNRRTDRVKDQRTLVMLHGLGGNRSTLFPIAAYLRLQGFKKILFYDYSSRLGVENAAIEFKKFLKKNVKGGRIDLVCHSMGGLVARAYLQLLNGSRRVDRVVTLGTPHRGTYNAYWLPTRVGDELRPDSSLIEKLKKTKNRNIRTQIFSIVAGSDNIVLPRTFGSFEKSIHIPDIGHLGVLVSKKVMSKVASCLRP